MKVIMNVAGGVFTGYQEVTGAHPKMQPCFLLPHSKEQVVDAVVYHTDIDAEQALKALKKLKHNVYVAELVLKEG